MNFCCIIICSVLLYRCHRGYTGVRCTEKSPDLWSISAAGIGLHMLVVVERNFIMPTARSVLAVENEQQTC